jgi:excisionase family DNA binding protein
MSQNPFEQIETRLNRIESILINLNETKSKGDKELDSDSPIYIQEAALLLGYTVKTLYTKCSRREIPFSKKGGILRFNKSELLNWINSGRKATTEEILNEVLNNKGKK